MGCLRVETPQEKVLRIAKALVRLKSQTMSRSNRTESEMKTLRLWYEVCILNRPLPPHRWGTNFWQNNQYAFQWIWWKMKMGVWRVLRWNKIRGFDKIHPEELVLRLHEYNPNSLTVREKAKGTQNS